jgi:hypothetical protein
MRQETISSFRPVISRLSLPHGEGNDSLRPSERIRRHVVGSLQYGFVRRRYIGVSHSVLLAVEHNDTGHVQCCYTCKECRMANDKNLREKQPGENPEGTYHFNPGNMAGKKPGEAEQTDENRGAPHDRKEKEKPASWWPAK